MWREDREIIFYLQLPLEEGPEHKTHSFFYSDFKINVE